MYLKQDEIERRCLPASEVRIDGDASPRITGYAAVFDVWADIGGWFREKIKPGAFAKTIKEADIRALMNHNENYVLGRNKAGTLMLREDDKGLAVEIDPVSSTWADDLMKSMRRGDINQMSFGFQVNKQELDYDNDERVLVDVSLFDVSVVTFPAYPTTSAQVRSAFQKHAAAPPSWDDLDRIIQKVKSGEKLIDNELRVLTTYIPNLSPPAASHAETATPPAASHAAADTRKGDKWAELYIRAEMQIPTTN